MAEEIVAAAHSCVCGFRWLTWRHPHTCVWYALAYIQTPVPASNCPLCRRYGWTERSRLGRLVCYMEEMPCAIQ